MVSLKEKFWGEWTKLKNGRNEIAVIWGTINFILLIAIKTGVDLSLFEIIGLGFIFLGISYLIGCYVTENVSPEINRVNPFAQDNINSAIFLQDSFICYFKYLLTKDETLLNEAIDNMYEAKRLREKWLK